MTETWTYSVGDHPDYHEGSSRYAVPLRSHILTSAKTIPGALHGDFEAMAEWCAEDFHSNHDGWEARWPVEFRIYEEGKEVARLSVDRETVPHFSAVPIREAATP